MSNPVTSSEHSSLESTTENASLIRWRIVMLLMAYAGLCHFNRISMSVAGTEKIIKQFDMDPIVMGSVYSAYLVAYTICMMPGGLLIDRWGPKRALVLMGFGSAVFVALTGFPGSPWLPLALVVPAFLLIRALTGIVTAPIHPGAARMISFSIPVAERARTNGLVNGAALVGIASTYTVFGELMDLIGWPLAFVASGLVTGIVAAIWLVSTPNDGAQHRCVNPAGRKTVGNDIEHESDWLSASAGIGVLFTNRSLILLTISYAAVGYFQYLFFYWIQYYFDEILHLGKDKGRLYATICSLAMAAGMFLGGWLADRIHRRMPTKLGRALVPMLGMIAGAVFTVLGLVADEPIWSEFCFALAMAAVGAAEGPFWVTAIELGGRRGGSSAAIFNTGGNIGGLLAPVVTPIIGEYATWQGGIGLACAFCMAGAILWAWIDPAERSQE
jgi:MFS family permease